MTRDSAEFSAALLVGAAAGVALALSLLPRRQGSGGRAGSRTPLARIRERASAYRSRPASPGER